MPGIVYVDDKPEEFTGQLPKDVRDRFVNFTFENGEVGREAFEAAKSAHVWLFDFFLVEQNPAIEDENGLSLFQKWRAAMGDGRPTTVVVSNDLQKALGQDPGPIARRHVIAQRIGVEWIGDKSRDTVERILQLEDAANGIAKSSKALEGQNSGDLVFDLASFCLDVLKVPAEASWANSAQRQVDRARPPRIGSGGGGVVRVTVGWLLAHVLPYPSFLLTDAEAALRLGVTPASVEKLERNDAGPLGAAVYKGPLCDFLGRRWWRAGIDRLAFDATGTEASYEEALAKATGSTDWEHLTLTEPVLLSNADLVETNEVAEASECVRVVDEDFPADVEPAWVRINEAKADRQLAAKVIFEDRDVLRDGA